MKAWFDFLAKLETHFGKETLERWLFPLKVERYDACNLHLQASDNLQKAWFEEQIRPLLKTGLVNNNFHPIKVHITITGQEPVVKKTALSPKTDIQNKNSITPDEIDSNNTFSTFIVSEKNDLAYKLLSDITGVAKEASLDLGNFNPIFLYGKEATGKTHLLHAVAQALKEKGLNVLYIKTQTFSQHVISAMREGQMEAFRQVYRNVDVLLVDDIQYFARKSATQEELFHTFNTLHTQGKQIILTANTSPITLKDIEARLISRFEWGISLPLEPLEKDNMKKFLTQKASSLDLPLTDDLSNFLLTSFGNSTAHLQKALETLVFKAHLQGLETTLSSEQAELLLSNLSNEIKKEAVSPAKIIQIVSEYYGIQPSDITGKCRSREFSLPRQIVMYLCRNRLQLPFQQIGRTLNRDHSTVMTSVRQIQSLLEKKEKDIFIAYMEISKKLQ